MASLSITPADVAEVKFTNMSKLTLPASETVVRGDCVRFVPATGLWALADAGDAAGEGTSRYIVIGGNGINLHTAVKDAIVDLGLSVLDAGDFGDPVYLSDTPGELTLAILESTTERIVGYIVPLMSGDTINKALQIVA